MNCPTQRETGAAVVEFAIAVPLLVVLVLGIIDYGRLTTTRITLHEAAQEGSIYGSTHPDDPAGIRQRVIESVDSPVIDPTTITVDCPDSQLRIRIGHPMNYLTPISAASTTLHAEVTTDIFTTTKTCVPSP